MKTTSEMTKKNLYRKSKFVHKTEFLCREKEISELKSKTYCTYKVRLFDAMYQTLTSLLCNLNIEH